jgi:hypothetical protein
MRGSVSMSMVNFRCAGAYVFFYIAAANKSNRSMYRFNLVEKGINR